jgi:hypothetical protein
MFRSVLVRSRLFFLAVFWVCLVSQGQSTRPAGPAGSVEMPTGNGKIALRVLVESPAETSTELQIICLFRSDPSNTLHGSLAEIDHKLKGLLDRIRQPNLFAGELGETVLILPPPGTVAARRLLIIGLGDSATFTPVRMEFVGAIVYRETVRLGIGQPYFAPTILDGGVTKFSTGEVAEQFVSGFRRAAQTNRILRDAGAGQPDAIESLTYLAGALHATTTLEGIEKAVASEASPGNP